MNRQETIEQAKQLYYKGIGAYKIAKELNVSITCVYYWIKNNFKIRAHSYIKSVRKNEINSIINYLNKDDNLTSKNYTQWVAELGITPYSLHIASFDLEIIDGKVVERVGKLRGERLKTKPYMVKKVSPKDTIMNKAKELILKGATRKEVLQKLGCSSSSFYSARNEIKKDEQGALSSESNKKITESPNSIRNIRKRQIIELLKVDETLTNLDLAQKLNVSPATIANYLQALSSEHNFGDRQMQDKKHSDIKQINKARVKELMEQDPSLNYSKIARLTGLSSVTVRNYMIEFEEERIFGA